MKRLILSSLLISLITGCVSNAPFSQQQINLINSKTTVIKDLPSDHKEPLYVYSRSGKTGSEVAGVVVGLLTGSFGYRSEKDTPRTRMEHNSPMEFIKVSSRKASAEKIYNLLTPTIAMNELLKSHFSSSPADSEINPDALTITIKPVTWHLYYDKLFNNQETYFLEYAADINMLLPSGKLERYIPCDKQSETALTKKEWLANDSLRIRDFANTTAEHCTNQILTELGKQPSQTPQENNQ